MSHVVAGATMAIVRVSFLREASQVEPCAEGALRWVQFFVCFLPRFLHMFCSFAHSEVGRRGGSEGELRVFVFL